MKDIIKQLQEYQIEAVQKGISYILDVNVVDANVSSVEVSMYHSDIGEVLDYHNFRTSISADDKFTSYKLKRIEKFIKNVEEKK